MREISINKSEEGRTLIKYLKKIFNTMPESLLQKLIRKKYFEINGKKANGKEVLNENDLVKIHLSDETYEKFHANDLNIHEKQKADFKFSNRIIYEDDNIIIFNKPAGMLSQGDKSLDESVNQVLNSYIVSQNSSFKPSVVNRLDRNTEGLIIFAKTYLTAKAISRMIKENNIEKRYRATINGILDNDSGELVNLYKKDEVNNKAILKDYNGKIIDGYSLIKLKYKVLKNYKCTSDIDIELITGKSHQIRAQFAYIGHPLVSDKKYMDIKLYDSNLKEFKTKSQKLICYKIRFGKFEEDTLKYLSNKVFKI